MRLFLHIGFDGSKFHGWQWQPNSFSVQQAFEDTLKKIFKEKITVYGCGRTDAGVHASQYFIHINLKKSVDFDLKFRLNKNLPNEIVVYDVIEVDDSRHARYDAILRTYDYFLHLQKDPIITNYSSFYDLKKLDFEAMQNATKLLENITDFKTLCRKPHLYKHTLCKVTNSHLFVDSNKGRLRFSITANRFLQGMIRITVFYLLKIGMGKLSVVEFEEKLHNRIEDPIKRLAHPNGLYLTKVVYPFLDLEPKSYLFKILKVGLE